MIDMKYFGEVVFVIIISIVCLCYMIDSQEDKERILKMRSLDRQLAEAQKELAEAQKELTETKRS